MKYSFATRSGIKVIITRSDFHKLKSPPFLEGRYLVIRHWRLGYKDFDLLLFNGEFFLVEYTHDIDLVSSLRTMYYEKYKL